MLELAIGERSVNFANRLALPSVTLALVVLVVAITAAPSSVLAHAEPESSTPPIGGTVEESPAEVEVVFTQEVVRQGNESALLVVDELGNDVTSGPSEVDDADRTIIRVPLQPDLPDGVYSVLWNTVSASDGDDAAGSFNFTVAGPAPTETETPPEVDGGTPTEEETPPTEVEATATEEETPSPTAEVAGEDDDDGGIPTWAIALAVVGVIVVAGLAGGAYLFVRSE